MASMGFARTDKRNMDQEDIGCAISTYLKLMQNESNNNAHHKKKKREMYTYKGELGDEDCNINKMKKAEVLIKLHQSIMNIFMDWQTRIRCHSNCILLLRM
eukprot:267178_1